MNALQKIKTLIAPEPDLTHEEVDAAAEASRIALDAIRPTIR